MRMPAIKKELEGRPSHATPAPSSARVNAYRALRSGAPSIDTRQPPRTANPATTAEDTESDDEIIFMEVRPKTQFVKTEFMESTLESTMAPNNALLDLGRNIGEINKTLGHLQTLGVANLVTRKLPELVLVGDQSAGKSSLMSALAGLSLPRDSGTCTRCPTHIRISPAAEWTCHVYLDINYDYKPPPSGKIYLKDVTRTNRFPPWTKRPTPQRIEFKFINDQYASDGTETVLRWAQKAILNPTTPPDVFITKAKEAYVRGQDLGQDNHGDESPDSITLEDRDEAQFSPNTIALEVSGPGLEELSFYDLPGIIMTAQREEDRFLTEVIRNFSREYISHPGAMILWALPMNNDPECSAAGSFIGDAKAFDRCIGVMTKADLLPQGNVKNWLQMLENKSHVTGHGYFVTYRTNRPGITLNEQNLAEDKFFNREMESDETVFWPEEFDKFRARCGLQNLKHHLSWKLAAQFAQVLPELKSQIAHQLEDITRSLEGLPEVPENKELEIMQSLSKFADLVRSSTQSRDFLVRWGQIADHFRDRILGLKPKYVIKEPPVIRTMEQDGLEMFADIVTITTPRKRPNPGGEASPSKRPRMARPAARSLSDMREIIRNSRLPGQNDVDDADFYAPLLLESLEPWTRPLADFVEYTIRLLKNMLVGSEGHDAQAQHGGILGQAFARLTKRDIYTRSRQHINAFIDQRKASLMKQLQAYYAMELQRPFTQDGDRERHNREKEKAILTRARTHQRMLAARIACGQEDPDVVLRERLPKMEELTEEQLRKEAHTRAKNEEKLGPDPYGREISVMAHVRGYYLTAAFRFIDVVSMHIISRLFPEVQNEMDDHLQDKLGLKAGPGRAQQRRWDDLMAESPGIVEHRKQLKAKKENLGKALESIVSLERELGAAVTRQTTPPARSTPARSTPARSSGDDTEMLDVPGSGGTRTAAGSRQPSVYAETMGNGAA